METDGRRCWKEEEVLRCTSRALNKRPLTVIEIIPPDSMASQPTVRNDDNGLMWLLVVPLWVSHSRGEEILSEDLTVTSPKVSSIFPFGLINYSWSESLRLSPADLISWHLWEGTQSCDNLNIKLWLFFLFCSPNTLFASSLTKN